MAVWVVEYSAVDGGSLLGLFTNRDAAVGCCWDHVRMMEYEGMTYTYDVTINEPQRFEVRGPHERWEVRLQEPADHFHPRAAQVEKEPA